MARSLEIAEDFDEGGDRGEGEVSGGGIGEAGGADFDDDGLGCDGVFSDRR